MSNKIKPLDQQIKSAPSLICKLPFSLYITGQKCSGKSTMMINMLLNENLLNNKFNQIYIISDTAALDEKMQNLKTHNIVKPNKELIKALKKEKKLKFQIFAPPEIEEYDRKIPEENFIEEPSLEFLQDLIQEQKLIIKRYGKEIADDILLVYDDTIAYKKFWNSTRVRKMIFNSRHFKISIIITSQDYKSLPKAIRLQNSNLVLYQTCNKDELKSIYSENSSKMPFNDFMTMLDDIYSNEYSFLSINYQNPKHQHRFVRNFEEFVTIE